MRHAGLMTMVLALATGMGCAAAEAPMAMDAQAPPAAPPAQPMPEQAPGKMVTPPPILGAARTDRAPSARGAKEVEARSGDDKNAGDHLLIFTGSVDLEVPKVAIAKSIDEIVDAAAARGGYVSKQTDQSVTVRVPSKSFRATMREIEKLGDVLHRGVQAQDVTEEFHDLGVRLKSLQATRARLSKFLDRAKNIEEVLRVEKELARLNSEIDRIEGRMRFLSQRSAMSTIAVALTAKPVAKKVVVEEPPPPPPPQAAKTRPLPISWIAKVGLDALLDLNEGGSK